MHSNDDAIAVKATTAGMDTEDVTLRDALLSTKKSCLKVRSHPGATPAAAAAARPVRRCCCSGLSTALPAAPAGRNGVALQLPLHPVLGRGGTKF